MKTFVVVDIKFHVFLTSEVIGSDCSASRPGCFTPGEITDGNLLIVAGSSPDEVDFLNLRNPSDRTTALESTQPLTEMSTRNL
jgi:hypothetical protein